MTYIINPNETIPTIEDAVKNVNYYLWDADCGVTKLYTDDYVKLSLFREALYDLLWYLRDCKDVDEIRLDCHQMELTKRADRWAT